MGHVAGLDSKSSSGSAVLDLELNTIPGNARRNLSREHVSNVAHTSQLYEYRAQHRRNPADVVLVQTLHEHDW